MSGWRDEPYNMLSILRVAEQIVATGWTSDYCPDGLGKHCPFCALAEARSTLDEQFYGPPTAQDILAPPGMLLGDYPLMDARDRLKVIAGSPGGWTQGAALEALHEATLERGN